ncbi:MAG: DUF378 domain-containing protein [Chitinivibrionales bacterium]|nr:DUF378 domain-containing protein [Chitinivibrionales bacterium]
MRHLNVFDWIALVLLIIGGINWGLVGFFDFNLVSAIFGEMTAISRVIYALVGISALYVAIISPSLGHRAHGAYAGAKGKPATQH